jgi:hypothetical protein
LTQQWIVGNCHPWLSKWIHVKWLGHTFGCLCFHNVYKHGLLHVKEINIQRLNNLIYWKFHPFQFTILFLDNTKIQRKRNFTFGCIQNWGYKLPRAFINSESRKCLFNFFTCILATIAHWYFTCAMDAQKNPYTHVNLPQQLHTKCELDRTYQPYK